MKIQVFWDAMQYELVNTGKYLLTFEGTSSSSRRLGLFDPEDEFTVLFQNISNYLPVNMA
jgi:hypothetical protein